MSEKISDKLNNLLDQCATGYDRVKFCLTKLKLATEWFEQNLWTEKILEFVQRQDREPAVLKGELEDTRRLLENMKINRDELYRDVKDKEVIIAKKQSEIDTLKSLLAASKGIGPVPTGNEF
jgi:hypothetical protein